MTMRMPSLKAGKCFPSWPEFDIVSEVSGNDLNLSRAEPPTNFCMAKQKTAANLSKAIDLDGKMSGALPAGYTTLLANLKARVHAAQLRAAVSVNRELILLYWDIGKIIVESQKTKGYGKQVVERLAEDLHTAFPKMDGFSPRNVWRMRSF